MPFEETSFKRLFELSGDAMMLVGEGHFVYANPAALHMFLCPTVEIFCTKHPADVSPEFQPCGTSSRELAEIHIQHTLAHGDARFEWVHQRSNGARFYSEVILSPGVWRRQPVIQAVIRDISSYKLIQQQLEQQREASEQAAKAKSEFLAVMSHEIRTPIHGILGAQELLIETPLDGNQHELANLAINSTRRLLDVVNDVLDFSKIDAGKMAIEAISFNHHDLLTRVFDMFKLAAAEKSIHFALDAPEADHFIVGDPTRTQQVLSNLVSNAIKFTAQGGTVTLRSEIQAPALDKGHYIWQLNVADTGIGMTERQQLTIFDVFTQADSSISRSYGGTGLGLSISKALIELMDGELTLQSEFGVGSTFTATIPTTRGQAPDKSAADGSPELQRNYQCTVLVAEDNLTNQFIIQRKLQRLGLNPVVVNNGLEALQQYTASLNQSGQSSFSAVLMDVQMPVMNGIDTTTELRALGCQLPIFALTADVQIECRAQCFAAGMQAFIGKPFEEAKLIDLFDQYLN